MSLALTVVGPAPAAADDEYLTDLYNSLNDSPMQRKLRALKPFPVGVVYFQQRSHDMAAIKREFATIRATGFDSLKQIVVHGEAHGDRPGTAHRPFFEAVQNAALDAGLYPWYYGVGGWVPIDKALLERLNIPTTLPLPEIQAHPAMVKYQTEILRKRIVDARKIPPLPTYAAKGEPGRGHPFIPERLAPAFAAWLQKTYGTMDGLKQAWHIGWVASPGFTTFQEAATQMVRPRDTKPHLDFRRYRDSLRFQADTAVNDYDRLMKHHLKYEPWEPVRTGGHHLLDNQAYSGWDLEAQAHAAAQAGSFYSSVHLAHHLRDVKGELDRPVYLQARTVVDSFKGGWAALWESTGGPTMWSGYNSLTVDAGLMTRLMLTYVAAGLKGIGIWTWNARDVGSEVGEYALTDLNGRVTERGRVAGAIAKALQKHRFELWDTLGEPLVGVLYSWENEAMLGRLSLGAAPTNRAFEYQKQGSQSRIGLTRALLNANVPFELVTERNLQAGLAPRYKIIYMPHIVALSPELLDRLDAFVRGGGRLVADMPLLLIDQYGRRFPTGPGSRFEALFGATLDDFRNTENDPQRLGRVTLAGQYAQLTPTRAKVRVSYASGTPAVLESTLGSGQVVILNGELSRMAFRPGETAVEAFIVKQALGEKLRPRFRAPGVLAYRRAAPGADHYFLVNDGPARTVTVSSDRRYVSGEDAITGDALAVRGASLQVKVPAGSGRWIRLVRRP